MIKLEKYQKKCEDILDEYKFIQTLGRGSYAKVNLIQHRVS